MISDLDRYVAKLTAMQPTVVFFAQQPPWRAPPVGKFPQKCLTCSQMEVGTECRQCNNVCRSRYSGQTVLYHQRILTTKAQTAEMI